MAVACERDAIELCAVQGWKFDHTYEGRGSNYGQTMMLAYKNSSTSRFDEEYAQELLTRHEMEQARSVSKNKAAVTGKWVVCNYYYGKPMYASNGKYPFDISNAVVFTNKQQAETKALFMRRNGTYNWVVQKLR